MREQPHDDHAVEPRPGLLSSLLPRSRSLFTLRPVYHTEQPPIAPPRRPTRRTRLWLAMALISTAGMVVAAGLALHARASKRHEAPALVLVNGKCKAKETPDGQAERWGDGEITVHLDSRLASLGPEAPQAVETAFATWLESGAALPGLRFETASELPSGVGRDGKSSVVFAPIEIPGHKNDLAITIGYADASSGRIVEADIVLNSHKHFSLLTPDAADDDEHDGCATYDLQDVATHEAGHFFGLGEDFADPNATMFYKTGKCELKKRDLAAPDREVVTTLYQRELTDERSSAGCGANVVGGGRGPSAAGFCTVLGLLLLLLAQRTKEARSGTNGG